MSFSWCDGFSGKSLCNNAKVTYDIKTYLAKWDDIEDTSSRFQSEARAVTYYGWVPRGKAGADTILGFSLSNSKIFQRTWITSRSHKSSGTCNLYVLNLYNYEKYPGLQLLTVELHYTWVNPKLVLTPVQNWGLGRFTLWAFAEHPHWLWG